MGLVTPETILINIRTLNDREFSSYNKDKTWFSLYWPLQ